MDVDVNTQDNFFTLGNARFAMQIVKTTATVRITLIVSLNDLVLVLTSMSNLFSNVLSKQPNSLKIFSNFAIFAREDTRTAILAEYKMICAKVRVCSEIVLTLNGGI